jgi:elongation factor 1-gamma
VYDSFTGFFQRIEKLRKNAFGSMCVFGEDNNNSISGLWGLSK